jgi:vacuolar-type H+-ATPase subunit H
MDILRMLEELNELAVERPRSFAGVTTGLNKEEIAMQIAKIRASLPQELKQAVAKVRESERIVDSAKEDAGVVVDAARKEADRMIAEARKEADRIVEQAKLQQDRMVVDSEILKLAKSQGEEIRNSAERDSVIMRRGAEKYAYDVLVQLEGVVGKVVTTIEKGKQDLDRVPEPVNVPMREKVRVG